MTAMTKKIFLLSLLSISLLSCGKKDENPNPVSTPVPKAAPRFPQTQTYTNCNNQPGLYINQEQLCNGLQFNYQSFHNYRGNQAAPQNTCTQNSRRNVFKKYCRNQYIWQPNTILRDIADNQNGLKFICHLSDPTTRGNTILSQIIHSNQSVIRHNHFTAIITQAPTNNGNSINIQLYSNNQTFIGSTSHNYSTQDHHQELIYQRIDYRAQIICRPIQYTRQSSTSSGSSYWSWNWSWGF